MYSFKNKQLNSVFEIFSSRILIVFFAIITDILISRVMPIADRGIFSSLQGAVLLTAGLCTVGLEYGFMLAKKPPKLKYLISRYRQATTIIIPFTILTALILSWRYHLGTIETGLTIIIAVSEVFTIIFLPINLQYHSTARFGLIRISRRAILFAGVLLLHLVIGSGIVSLPFCLLVNAAAWVFSAVYSVAGIKKMLAQGQGEAESLLNLWKAGAGVFFAKFAERVQPRIGLVILGMASMPEQAAYFAVASLAIDLSIFISSSLSVGILVKHEKTSLISGTILFRICLIAVLFNVLVAGAIWLLIEPVLITVYGDLYLPVAPMVLVLAPVLVVYGVYPLLSTYLIKINKTRAVLFSNYFTLVINAMTAIILIACDVFEGGMAASISLAISLFLNSLIGLIIVLKSRKTLLKFSWKTT